MRYGHNAMQRNTIHAASVHKVCHIRYLEQPNKTTSVTRVPRYPQTKFIYIHLHSEIHLFLSSGTQRYRNWAFIKRVIAKLIGALYKHRDSRSNSAMP